MEILTAKLIEFLKGQSIQVAIVFVAVLILTWLLRNKSAHVRYLLWLLVAIKCLTPPLVIFSVPVLPAETIPVIVPTQRPSVEQKQPSVTLNQTFSEEISVVPDKPRLTPQYSIENRKPKIVNIINSTGVLLSVWAAGAACYLLWALGKAVRLAVCLRRIRKPLPAQLMIEQIELLTRLWNHPDGFNVWLVDGINQPFVWGLWRGAIYLPTRFQSIQGDKQKAIVLHEMAHVVRLDAFVNLIQILIQGVFWFHPFVWLANRAIRQEREKCCDEIAVARLGAAPKEYGSAIVDTLLQEAKAGLTIPTLAVAGPVKNIEDRIKTIMQPGRRFFHRPSTIAILIIGALAAFVVPTTIALTQKVTPPDYILSGTVVDTQTGKPIAGAIVFDDGYGPEPYQKGITDESGKFEYKSWNEEHNIAAKADGYQQQMMVFTTAPFDNSKNLNFKLQPDAEAKANIKNTATEKSSFTATLPDGVTVELVGVCEYPSEGKSWWSPNGTPLSKAPYTVAGDVSKNGREGYKNYEFALKLNRPDETSYYWMIPGGSYGSDTGSPKDENGRYLSAIKVYTTNQPNDQITALIRIGATDAPWQTIATHTPQDKEQTLKAGDYEIAFGLIYVRDKETLLPIVHNYNRGEPSYAIRMVAITKSGQIRQSGVSGRGGTQLDNLTYSFYDLPMDTIKEFQFQTRPYEWITFKNVSLKPGKKTDVKIEIQKPIVTANSKDDTGESQIETYLNIIRNVDLKEREQWFAAVKGLIEIGSPAVPALCEELRKTDSPRVQRLLAFTLRGIGDASAVPALIEALSRADFSSDSGFGNADTDLAKFIQKYQIDPSRNDIGLGHPVREITIALERLTGHTEGQDHFIARDEAGKPLGSYVITPEIQDRQRASYREAAKRWERWWQDKQKSEANPGGLLAVPEGSELELHIIPEPSKDSWPQLSMDDVKKYKQQLITEGSFRGSIRGDSYQWYPVVKNVQLSDTFVSEQYNDQLHVLVCARQPFSMWPDGSWKLKNVKSTQDSNGHPAILIELDDQGALFLKKLTEQNLEKRLALIIDGRIISAPRIATAISKQVIITGNFTNQEVSDTVKALLKGRPPLGAKQKDDKGTEAEKASAEKSSTEPNFTATLPNGKKWVFKLTVIDKQTGKPLPGVQLELSADGPKSKVVTGQDGKYTVQLDKTPPYFGIRAEKERFVPMRVNWRQSPYPDEYTLALELGTSIGGIIRDEQGGPIEDVTVYLLVPGENEGERPAIWDYEVKTDSKGRWQCDIMPARLDDVRIRLAHPDFINDDVYGTTSKPSIEKLRDMTGVMIMKKGVTVAGQVLDVNGQAIKGAAVVQGSDRNGSHYPGTTTDDQGSFKFNNAKPGPMILTVQAAGFAPDLKEITISKEMSPVEFRLQQGNAIKGQIVDAQGNPVMGAFVAADTWRGHRSIEWRVNTDKEGRFQWNEAPSDEVLFDMGKMGFTCIRHYAMTPSKEDYLLTLHNALKISGKVVDAETGEPVKQFQAQSGIDWGTDRPVSWDPRDMKIFKNGIYEMIFDEPQQGYLIQINAEGYQSAVSRRFKTEEGDIAFDFKLTKQDWPGGIIKLPDGTPVAGAKVILCTPSQLTFIENGRNMQTSFSPFVETNAEGRFSFPPRTERYLLVVLHDRGCAEVSDKQLKTSSSITLQPWGRVEGTLRIGSRPGNNENIAIWAESSSRTSGEPRAFYQWETTTDSNGHFALERLKAGSVKVGRKIKTSDRSTSSSHGTPVEVKSGETATVSIGGTGRPIIGRVALPADYNQPVDWSYAEASISTKNENTIKEDLLRLYRSLFSEQAVGGNFCSYAIIIDPDGSFRAEDVPEGEYDINIRLYEPLPVSRQSRRTPITSLRKELKIAAMPSGRSDEPLDVGTLMLKVHNSTKSGQKTEAKIETQKPEVASREAEAKPEVPLDQKSIQTVTFKKDMPFTDALGMLSKVYKVNIIPSQEVANSRSKIGVTHLYDVNFEQVLKAVCGTTCTYEIKDDFIYVYTNEEYKALRPGQKTDVKIKTQKEKPETELQKSERALPSNSKTETSSEYYAKHDILLLDDIEPEFKDKTEYNDRLYLLDRALNIKGLFSGFNLSDSIGASHRLAVDSQRKTLWVVDDHSLWHFNLNTGDLIGKIPEVKGHSVAVDPSIGNVWVLTSEGTIYGKDTMVFSPDGILVKQYSIKGFDIVYNPVDHCFWIAGQSIYKVTLNGSIEGRIEGQIAWCAVSTSVDHKTGNTWILERAHFQVAGSADRLWIVDRNMQVQKKIDLGDVTPLCVSVDSENETVWVGCKATTLRFSTSGDILSPARQVSAFSVIPGSLKNRVIAADAFYNIFGQYEIQNSNLVFPNLMSDQLNSQLSRSDKWLAYVPFEGAKLKPAAKVEMIKQNPQFTATLPSGVTVELIGVCEDMQWWSPDGGMPSSLPRSDVLGQFDLLSKRNPATPKFMSDYKFLFKVTGNSVRDCISLQPAQWEDGTFSDNFGVKSSTFSESEMFSDITLNIPAGPWNTLLDIVPGEKKVHKIEWDTYRSVSLGDAFEENGKTHLPVTFVRIVGGTTSFLTFDAIDKNGDSHQAEMCYYSPDRQEEKHWNNSYELMPVYRFDLSPEKIKHYELKFRPIFEVSFKNVSLKPGQKTDVKIEIPAELKQLPARMSASKPIGGMGGGMGGLPDASKTDK